MSRNFKIIISGGGTGGHIFPAISIANAIKIIAPETEILFVGAKGRMEMEKVPAAGYKIVGLNIAGLQRKLTFSNFLFPLKVAGSLMQAKNVIDKFKPDVAVGVGGYASGPLLFMAGLSGIPCLIQEQNSYAGITNKILGKKAKKICVAYQGMEKFFPPEKIILTGNPVRQDLREVKKKREQAILHFNLDHAKKTIVVIGGSLGARTINHSIEKNLGLFYKHDFQLLWQTGKAYAEHAINVVKNFSGNSLQAFPFIKEMDLAYAVADVVVSRAGASTLSELALVQKPSILVPSPNVAEDHQTKNALSLTEKNAAILIPDKNAMQELGAAVVNLLQDQTKQEELGKNISLFAKPYAAETIAKEVLKIALK